MSTRAALPPPDDARGGQLPRRRRAGRAGRAVAVRREGPPRLQGGAGEEGVRAEEHNTTQGQCWSANLFGGLQTVVIKYVFSMSINAHRWTMVVLLLVRKQI